MKHYDAIIIGSGQAGNPLAKKLAAAGMKTAIIEKRLVGGTCINDGCTPTKTWVASAKMAYMAQQAIMLGIQIDGYKVDMPTIKKRKDEVVAQFRESTEKGLETTKGVDLVMGEATFIDKKTISVKLTDGDTKKLIADKIFINSGTKTAIPDIEGLNTISYLTSTSILDLNNVPEHLLIIGASYIGMEFGQMFRRFGSKVTMLETSVRVLPHEDEDIAEEIAKLLDAEKIKIYTGAKATRFKKFDDHIEAQISIDDKKQLINCSHVLVAAGRFPQTEVLNLKATGVKVDERGYIKVNNKLETNVRGIYALGDVKGGPAFTHIAYNDYTIVYRNLVEKAKLSIKNRLVPYCMFTDPPLGRVGLSETEAKKQGLKYKVAKLPMAHVARAIETGDTRGFMKAVVDAKTKKILGVAVLGQEGGEIMSVLQMAMISGITYDEIRYMVFAHPLYSESLNNLFITLEP